MRILVWSIPFLPVIGGREVFAANLARELARRGHDVLVVGPEFRGAAPFDTDLVRDVHVERLPVGALVEPTLTRGLDLPTDLRAAGRRVGEIVTQFRPEVVHAQAVAADLALIGGPARESGVPIVATDHCLSATPDLAVLGVAQQMARVPRSVVAVSTAAAAALGRLVPSLEGRVRVVHNGVRVPADHVPVDPGADSVVCLGRLSREKGVAVALTAWSVVARQRPRLTLTIAGDGPDRPALELLAAHLGVGDRVLFSGWRTSREAAELIRASSLVLIPSLWSEPFGLVAAEAAAQGRPVIASRVGGLPEVVIDQQTGLLVDPGDILGLVGTLNGLLADPGRVRDLGAAARQHAVAHLSFDACVDRYETVYRELAAS